MKQILINSEPANSLHIVFAGWGMDERPFENWKEANEDLMICFDYTDLCFDESKLREYKHIRLTAWSMGVWAAASVFCNKNYRFNHSTAINGTHTPVNNTKGIPVATFEATLASLNEKNRERFNRRMCNSDKDVMNAFYNIAPKRDIGSLQTELAAIGRNALVNVPEYEWDLVIIGENDLIFPFQNQVNAWEGHQHTVIRPIAHYADFRLIIKRNG